MEHFMEELRWSHHTHTHTHTPHHTTHCTPQRMQHNTTHTHTHTHTCCNHSFQRVHTHYSLMKASRSTDPKRHYRLHQQKWKLKIYPQHFFTLFLLVSVKNWHLKVAKTLPVNTTHFVPCSLCACKQEEDQHLWQKYPRHNERTFFPAFIGKEWTYMAAPWEAQIWNKEKYSFYW